MKHVFVYIILLVVIALSIIFPHVMLNPGELTDFHQEIKNDCLACHKPFGGIESSRCINCHKLDEIGLKVSSDVDITFHAKLKNQACVSCHSDHLGIHPKSSISRFDHSIFLRGMRTNCSSCHIKPSDKMHDQFQGDCKDCHNTSSWDLSGTFDHSVLSDANMSNCLSCHKRPSDSFHKSTEASCTKCHTTNRWTPSTFDHNPYFILDNDHDASCATCHTNNNYNIYTCYGCHEHSESNIAGEHREEGIYNFRDCITCHKSANEHDIRMNRTDNNGKIKDIKESNGKQSHKKRNEGEEDDDD